MPNLFRGPHRMPTKHRYSLTNSDERIAYEEALAEKYAEAVREKCSQLCASGCPPTAFIAEPLSGNAGGVELPKGYLEKVYRAVRQVGGLCICDVVQVGYGRLATVKDGQLSGFWGFEEHGVRPDILTMAKAAGNGHPLGYVITTRDISDDFQDCEGSFFSSAGGGPVSCAVGMAVLQVIEEQQLELNAAKVGAYLNAKLIALSARFPLLIGCIHGHGLYQGIELVDGRHHQSDEDKQDMLVEEDEVLPPGKEIAYAVCDRLLDLGVVCHGTGDFSNVLKVKPPLCMTFEDADFFVSALQRCCEEGW
eukprot:CAMPEP_0170059882 /NCGR_PEP_ID=MMETSP0019_2-20121128/2007_1 /TAXON_ID=98059 /ORGANISM="Dinobryon sp., Strain UTEXLB2267" /LENGTH=306 /DNA_ID=CAMNT_0010265271 /DNA_START=1 /DNA_END=921 /DNA_ORIENTATION=-